jgi:hypothetical protein
LTHTEFEQPLKKFSDRHDDLYKFQYPKQSEQYFYYGDHNDKRSIPNLRASKHIVSASRPQLSNTIPFLPVKSMVWRDANDLSDNLLKVGGDPSFDLNENWYQVSSYEYNEFLQPTLTTTKVTENKEEDVHSCTLYEGPRRLPVANFANAHCNNVLYLGGENGQPPSEGSLYNYWSVSGSVTYTEYSHFSGNYSLALSGNDNPESYLYLKDVKQNGFGYVVSVWMKSNAETAPELSVYRGSYIEPRGRLSVSSPHEGRYTPRQWQRYQLTIPNDWIIGDDGLFSSNSNGSALIISAGNPSGIVEEVFLDDFVGFPSDATFSLSAYDTRGRLSSKISNNFLVSRFERDMFGTITATRDENFKIFSQSATHRIGENGAIQEGAN